MKIDLVAFAHDEHHNEISQHKLVGRAYVIILTVQIRIYAPKYADPLSQVHLYNAIHHVILSKSER